MSNLSLFFSIGGAYIIGALPSGYWFAKYFFNIDITQHGSGNIGASNVARVLGSKKYFLLIFLLDAAKAYTYLSFLQYYDISSNSYYLIASMLLIGNAYSVFLNYRGGKGVATALGILSALAPAMLVVIFAVSWAAILACFRSAAAASFAAIVISLISYGFIFDAQASGLCYFLVMLLFWFILRHHSNIRKMLRSEESS